MKEFSKLLSEELKQGLVPYTNRPRNVGGLRESFNLEVTDEGLACHEEVVSITEDRDWGQEEVLTPAATTRDITIVVRDYVSEDDVEGAMIYIDGNLAGTADVNGELLIEGIAIGGHSIKITKAGYLDSDADYLLNDYFVVT